MRPLAAAVRPWHPSELARLGRNAVEDPPQAGCLGRTAAAPWRISRRGWASARDGRGGRGGCHRRTTWWTEATGLAQRPAAVLAARSMAGHELPPSPLAPREGSSPEGPRRRRRLGHAAVFGRVIEPDPTEGRGTPKCTPREAVTVALANSVVDARERQGRHHVLPSPRANVYLDPRHSWCQRRGMRAPRTRRAGCQPRPVGPEKNGASRDRRGIERTEVAAVEAPGVVG